MKRLPKTEEVRQNTEKPVIYLTMTDGKVLVYAKLEVPIQRLLTWAGGLSIGFWTMKSLYPNILFEAVKHLGMLK